LDKTKFLNLYSVSNIVRVIGLRTRERWSDRTWQKAA
jgi:hypothetical protein